MAMVRFTLLVLSLAWGIPRDCAGQRYAIIAPRTVRPHIAYDLVVTNLEATKQTFLFEIVNSNETIVGISLAKVKPNELRNVQIPLKDLDDRSYKLKVWKEQTFINATELEYIDRSYLVLFQTDKPAYKPGDIVQFRVVFLFPNAYPVAKTARPSIFITDPEKFRIKQWINASLTSGVFEGSFPLAEYTTLGLWTIGATLNQQHYKDVFRVEEYTLPLFKIKVQSVPNPYFHCEDTHMTLKVRASFANGGPVQGNATVVVRTNYNNYPTQTREVARKEIPINGVANVQFRTDVVAENCDEERNVWFDVTVTESSTGVSYSITSAMMVHNTEDATMQVLDGNSAFYPGFPMHLKVQLTTLDEKPLANRTVAIVCRVQQESDADLEAVIPKLLVGKTSIHGIIKFTVNTTLSTVQVNVDGNYNNQTFPLVFAYPMYEDNSVEYLVAHTRLAYYNIDKNITFDVYSNVKIKRIYYIGYCCGIVCASGVQESSHPVHNHQFMVMSKPVMKPQMNILFFTIKADGKVLSTTVVARIVLSSNATLNITVLPREPDSVRAVFSIKAESDAFVGMLGVDERVLQRSSANNDISQRKLEAAIQGDMNAAGVMWSSYDSFGSVGVTLLTDGYLPDVGYVPHSLSELARAGKTLDDDYHTRKDFPETWIWHSLKVPKNGQDTLEQSLPDSITTWMVNGFSVGPVNGMQIMKKPLQIPLNKPIFAQLFLPPSIKRLEEVTVHCLVHNHGTEANVTLQVRSMPNRTLYLAKGATETVPVTLYSAKVGTLSVDIVLRTPQGKVIDALRQKIPVRPEGLLRSVDDVRVLDFTKSSRLSFNLSLPETEVVGSTSSGEVTLSVIGTFLNLHSFDLEQMVKSSHGNGEENLLFLQTTMAVYDYLQKVKRLQRATKEKLLSYMEVAYQQLLRYRLDDGSYSVFGNMHECGSVWFTASTVESLRKVAKYIAVEETPITDGLKWLVRQNREDGSFNESCTIVHPHIQRTGGKELSLASSVLFAFVGVEQVDQYEQLVNKTLALLRTTPSEDVYLLAKMSYLLAVMDHPDSAEMLEKLNKKVITNGKYRYWSVLKREPSGTANIRDQETTAYALLANIRRDTIDQLEMIRIAQWLQKHTFAGDQYVPSLERIIALEALSMVARKIPTHAPNMYLEAGGYKLTVNSTNQQLLQSVILPNNTRSVKVLANGSGLALLKLSYRYTLSDANVSTGEEPSNSATTKQIPNRTPIQVERTKQNINGFTLHFCSPVFPSWDNIWKTTIDFPTGSELVEQRTSYGNTTLSSILLENRSRLELVWYGFYLRPVCYTIPVRYSSVSANNRQGLVYHSAFDTKNIFAVQHF